MTTSQSKINSIVTRLAGVIRPPPAAPSTIKDIQNILTTTNAELDEELVADIDEQLRAASASSVVDIDSFPPVASLHGTDVSLYRGDITKLYSSSSSLAIVNAANSSLLGCFHVDHPCIDNAIHAWSGPSLRKTCRDYMETRGGEPFPVAEDCLITKSFALPSDYVIHVVGPQAKYRGHEQPELLSLCYERVLGAARDNHIGSVALSCISAGMYGYPPEAAAQVATSTVIKWLEKEENRGVIHRVVFNVFTPHDHALYQDILPRSLSTSHDDADDSDVEEKEAFKLAAEALEGATAVLVAAGAGMSIDAGIDFYDKVSFKRRYPGIWKRGYRYCYEMIGNEELKADPLLKWGYYIPNVYHVRYNDGEINFTPYRIIKELIGGKPYFVYTSNVDGLFERSGFDVASIYTPQGDMKYLQCYNKCSDTSYWNSKEAVFDLFHKVDHESQLLEEQYHPTCPKCRGKAIFNLRGGDYFMHHDQHRAAKDRMHQFIAQHTSKPDSKLVILDVGTGFNTPSVIRWPMENLFANGSSVTMIRVNLDHPNLDRYPQLERSERFHGFGLPALEALEKLKEAAQRGRK